MLEDGQSGLLALETPHVKVETAISEIGIDDQLYDVSGELPRFIKIFRLPDVNPHRSLSFSRPIRLSESGDNPVYIRLTQEDGTRAWTSPVYIYR